MIAHRVSACVQSARGFGRRRIGVDTDPAEIMTEAGLTRKRA